MEKTTREFWNGLWRTGTPLAALRPRSTSILCQYDRSVDAAVSAALSSWGGSASTLIELGCGGSPYLPYFAKHHGLQVSGLDYSDIGCARARAVLQAEHAAGTIVEGDIFSPPPELLGRFDIGFSMGLVEHFTDTAAVLSALRKFVRPGGLMITGIPNMTGLPGRLQSWLDRPLYEMHQPLDAAQLAAAHRAAGLTVLSSTYLMTLNLYVLHYRNERSPVGVGLRALRGVLMRLVFGAETWLGRSFPNRVTSPYILCIARVPGAPG
jgi:SAM-dependent methyltransferase